MNNSEIMKLIDNGANFYCRQLGNASHMEFMNNGYYSMIYPKAGQEGGTSLFDVTLDHLDDEDALKIINEIKALNVHTWWGLCLSDRLADLVWGKDRPILTPEQHEEGEEFYIAIFPDEKPLYNSYTDEITIKPVTTLDEFSLWADICNSVLHGGYPIMHRINHYDICKNGIMPCYIGYYQGKPTAVSAILNNNGISSLEFVATLDEFRGKGLARALCQKAVDDAFVNGSKIITTRAFAGAKNLYKSMGFKIYY
ncbi:MAG TPA: GNAT family N-acetyltransferase [Mobilitalea sp.]|nr:GNAT family N-acetyltransferase [Mobilitalea sp.]